MFPVEENPFLELGNLVSSINLFLKYALLIIELNKFQVCCIVPNWDCIQKFGAMYILRDYAVKSPKDNRKR